MVKKYTGNRDIRFVHERRGGTMNDATHKELALWSALCAEHVLPLFTQAEPHDTRPAEAIEATRAWANGEITMMQAREYAYACHAAARKTSDKAASNVARACGHAVATAHMADHELGGAYYALQAFQAAYPGEPERITQELSWQQQALTPDIRDLVLDDMRQRSQKFKGIFDPIVP